MKTEVENLKKCQARFTVSVEAAEYENAVKSAEKKYMQNVQIPGFRRGKVPLAMIRKEFAQGLKQEVESSLFRQFIDKELDKTGVKVIKIVGIDPFEKTDAGATFKVTADVFPKVKLPTYKGLKLTSEDTTVKDEDVENHLSQLREAFASYEEGKEGDVIAANDYVEIDYTGTIEGKPVAEIEASAMVLSEGRDFWAQAGRGEYFLKEIADALVGMKLGEKKDGIEVKFTKENAPGSLNGKTAVYSLTVKTLRRRILPEDAAFLEKLANAPLYKDNKDAVASIDALRADLRKKLEESAVKREASRRRVQAFELVLKKADFELPESQVEETMAKVLQDFSSNATQNNVSLDALKDKKDEILAQAREEAERQLRAFYLIQEIAKEEKIEVDATNSDDFFVKVTEFLVANAKG